MKDEYDFSQGKRGALIPSTGKTRITIYLDDAILEAFRARAEAEGTGYQTLINEALNAYLNQAEQPLTESALRRVLQEELPQYTLKT
ncbi:MAG: BrnA antitoxin family protein [Anaerolineales bacterium]|nr:BrnA antitoxin family protein [Anaerolineales bacterium]